MANNDRFDLEQNIMNCWSVINELDMLLEQGTVSDENIKAVAVLYEQKFQYLWENFENCCANKFGYIPELPNELGNSKQTYGVEQETEFDTFNDIGFPNDEDLEKRTQEEIDNS